ncbi:MAG TPA: formate C-acetyltransferase/glycerol dehydratase family glycyl radical enzyme, partial [Synergistaceae bacterium]|nr:formate C-acetyltransferase/glycerol dehydratase family glycyl radical enzyme [Synergistaceae bacterium]
MGLPEKPLAEFRSVGEIQEAFERQLANLIDHSVISSVVAQKLHMEMVPRPFLSTCVDGCMEKGLDLSKGGAVYNVGPVLTGIGLSVVANGLAAIEKLVFEDRSATLGELAKAMDDDWVGHEDLRKRALAAPKYGNDNEAVDRYAREISDFYYRTTRRHPCDVASSGSRSPRSP